MSYKTHTKPLQIVSQISMNRQGIKQKLTESIGNRFASKLAFKAGVSKRTLYRWFREDTYMNVDIEEACLSLIKDADSTREELSQYTAKE